MNLLFVCMGNICRSPVVEAVVRNEFARAGLVVDVASAATESYHIGAQADARSIASARAHGYDLSAHRARQIANADFAAFDAILAMDGTNLRALRARCPSGHAVAPRKIEGLPEGEYRGEGTRALDQRNRS